MAGIDDAEYERRVRDAVWAIVSAEYEAYERAGRDPYAQRFVGVRPFWSSFTFEGVSVEGRYPSTELAVRFDDSRKPARHYGFRQGIWETVSWWEQFGPKAAAETIRDAPERLGYEMVFNMVYTVADAPSEVFDGEHGNAIVWLTGSQS